jgi:hypothetical protein
MDYFANERGSGMVRYLLFLGIVAFIVWWFQYIFNPKRKLETAVERRETFFLDDTQNVRRNFLITYKGVLFEGQKYLGTTDDSFTVTKISIWPRHNSQLYGLSKYDFFDIEKIITESYPYAEIEWTTPVREFISRRKE